MFCIRLNVDKTVMRLMLFCQHRENCLAAQSLFRSFCLTPVSLQTELLPYLAKLTNPMRNQGNTHTLYCTIQTCIHYLLQLNMQIIREVSGPGVINNEHPPFNAATFVPCCVSMVSWLWSQLLTAALHSYWFHNFALWCCQYCKTLLKNAICVNCGQM